MTEQRFQQAKNNFQDCVIKLWPQWKDQAERVRQARLVLHVDQKERLEQHAIESQKAMMEDLEYHKKIQEMKDSSRHIEEQKKVNEDNYRRELATLEIERLNKERHAELMRKQREL